jgi:hypothetical protein
MTWVANWPGVIAALVITIPSIIAATFGFRNARSLKTGNEKTVGEMVTEVHGSESNQGTTYDTHGEAKNDS